MDLPYVRVYKQVPRKDNRVLVLVSDPGRTNLVGLRVHVHSDRAA
jgi:hypothetical protein